MKDSVVNFGGGSFCWNYATDIVYGNYAGDNVCCIYADFEVVLFVTDILVDHYVQLCKRLFLLQLCS